MNIQLKKLYAEATIPSYSREGDAALDLHALYEELQNGQATYGTGIAIKIPEGHVGLIFPRSSITKYDLALANSVGVIDSNYTGEIIVKFNLLKQAEYARMYSLGDRIAQLIILPIPQINFVEVDSLPVTNRGEQGFGSSGA